MNDITPRQQQVLDIISDFAARFGYPPSLREIAQRLGVNGTLGISKHLIALERKGRLRRSENLSRAITMPGATAAVSLPIVGKIRAGHLHPAIEDITGYRSVDKSMVKGEGCFFLAVEGDSMINKGILDGDIALIRPQAVAENGEIVAVMVDSDATLKQFFRERGRIRLQPANPNYKPIIIRPDQGEVVIVGKMIGLFRSLE
ncbi:MAG TPA: transcriptional repressor LexA [Desulfuromonadaceae bacterium]|jgi:repressor LexA